MGLVVIAIVVEQLVFAQAPLRGFRAEDVLKPHHLAECFG